MKRDVRRFVPRRFSLSIFTLLFATMLLSSSAWAGTVTVTSPTNGSTVGPSVHVHATYSATASYMKLWVDHTSSTVEKSTSTFDTYVTLAAGTHTLVVQAADASTGTVYNSPTITITVTSGNTVTVSPSSATVAVGKTQQFTATDSAGLGVTWSATGGTITSAGLYTAGNSPGTFSVTATDSTGAKGSATVTVTSSSTLTISPTSASVNIGKTQQFTANLPVTWSATGDGTINSSGLFTAGSTTGSATVTATATDGSGQTAQAQVTVTNSSLQVTWVTPTNGQTVTSPVHVNFTYNGTASYMKLWIDGVAQSAQYNPQVYDGVFSMTAGTHKLAGQAHDATSGITYTTNISITVSTGGTGVTVSPSSATTVEGQTQQFTANVAVTWTASCGTISSTGLFTAPNTTGTCTITATATDGSGATGTATDTVVSSPPPPSTGAYTTWKNGNDVTGQQRNETTLTLANVNSTTFGLKFSQSVDGYVYAQPLYMAGLTVNGGTHNVVFVATEHDSVYAFDADTSQAALWHTSLLMGGTTVPQANVGSTIYPEIGITSTPVIDTNSNTIYVVAETLEGSNYIFRIHALDLMTGKERSGSPVQIVDPNFQPKEQLQRPALLMANGNIYVGFGSQGDHSPYHGWIFSYNTSLSKGPVWNSTSTGSAGGIWGGGSALSADPTGNIFVTVGNGSYSPLANLSMSYVKLSPNLAVLDYFTPYDESTLSSGDRDLGSGGLLIVPPLSGTHPHVAIGCGKPSPIYVVDRDNMGHKGSTSDSQIIQSLPNVIGGTSGTQSPNDHCFMTAAFFQNNVYFVGNNDVMKVFTLDPSTGKLSTSPVSQTSFLFPFPGAQPVTSSNGSGNGIVWVVDHASGAALHAYDASDLSKQLYVSASMGTGAKWAVPTVINGKVYVGTKGHLYVYGLK